MNKPIKEIVTNQHGSIMLITMLILTSILVVSIGAANIVMLQLKMSGTQARSTKAIFAAEAGAERVLWQLRKELFDIRKCTESELGKYVDFDSNPAVCDSSAHWYPLGNNSKYMVASTSPWRTFNSKGEFSGVRRVVEIGF